MSVQADNCYPERIAGFLDRSLGDSELAALEDHLGVCSTCQKLLGNQTAAAELWDKASRYLRDEREELDPLTGASDPSPAQDRSHAIQAVLDSLRPTDDPEMLGRLGGLEVVGVVGAGAMGVVLKAFDRSLDRTVAVKVLAPHLASSGASRKRFAREAKAAAAVLHPNVMAIHSVSNGESLPHLVMPYIRGASLQRRLDQEGPLPLAEILRIGSQIAAGLAAAHAQGLVHRDIKPANILLEEGVERVAITDFGLARAVDDATLTRTGMIVGTPQYMAPEQARGDSVDQRSDLFSLGSVLYAMCTGRAPFRAETSYGVLRRITDEEPRPIRETSPEVPQWLCAIVAKLMAKRPEDRFQSAEQVADLLEDCLAHVQQPTTAPLPEHYRHPPVPSTGPKRWWPGAKVLTGVAFALVMILAGVLIVLELNKGTITIHCDADSVPVRITQGDKVVKEMIVRRSDQSVRIAAGRYEVELFSVTDGIVVKDGTFTLTRGQEHVVTITRERAESAPSTGHGDVSDAFPADSSKSSDRLLEVQRQRWKDTEEALREGNMSIDEALRAANELYDANRNAAATQALHQQAIESHLQRLKHLKSLAEALMRAGAETHVQIPSVEAALLKAEQLRQLTPGGGIPASEPQSQSPSVKPHPEVLQLVGILDYDERRILNVHTRLPGRIEKRHVDYRGVEVKKGDPLVTLYSEDLVTAEEEFLQVHRLNEKVSRPQNEQLLELARQRLDLMGLSDEQIDQLIERDKPTGRLTLFAPSDGIIAAMEAQEGDRVKSDTRLFTIADPTRLWARLHVNEAHAEWFRFASNVTLTAHAHPGQTYSGKVLFIEPIVDPTTRSVTILVEVSDPQSKWKPGMSVTASLSAIAESDDRGG